jgi:regulator of sigma E protease
MVAFLFDNVLAVPLLILFFSVSIFVHELGHFLAARWLGLVVDAFSIGFGPALWKRKRGGVVYKIGCIPIGGYVALPQLDPSGMQTVQGTDGAPVRNLPSIPPWKKIIVSVSGAAGNMMLAVLLAWVVYWIGMPAGPAERSATVGYVDPKCRAYAAGLRLGDEIVALNGKAVKNWRDLVDTTMLLPEVQLQYRDTNGVVHAISLQTERGMLGEQMLAGVEGRSLCTVLSVDAGMSADKAGIRSGDTIVEFAGVEGVSRGHLIDQVK